MRKGIVSSDLTGQRFGLLVVEGRTERPETASEKDRNPYWRCRCDCGGKKVVTTYNLRRGNTSHCGCKTLENKRKAGRIRAQKLLNAQGKSRVAGYKTPGGNTDLDQPLDWIAKECKCPQCGKVFDRLSKEWAYKRVHRDRMRYFCSYSCWRRDLQQKEPKRKYAAVMR